VERGIYGELEKDMGVSSRFMEEYVTRREERREERCEM